MRELLQDSTLAQRCLTFDALHTQYETLEMVQGAGGTYVAQVKANQPTLQEDLQDHINLVEPFAKTESLEKGHGRIEHRQAYFYHVESICFEEKWATCGFATLAVMNRESRQCKTGKLTQEISFYLSNSKPTEAKPEHIFAAIRQHWNIEADHWVRDCTFREDHIKCKEPAPSKTLAGIISVAGNLLRQQKKGNLKAMQEDLACNPRLGMVLFKHYDLL